VFFVSDRHGKPAIYWMNVERFVSATEESDVSALGRGGH